MLYLSRHTFRAPFCSWPELPLSKIQKEKGLPFVIDRSEGQQCCLDLRCFREHLLLRGSELSRCSLPPHLPWIALGVVQQSKNRLNRKGLAGAKTEEEREKERKKEKTESRTETDTFLQEDSRTRLWIAQPLAEIAPLRTDRKEKRDFRRQCITGQSSRLRCVVIHLGFASQAEGGELKQQHKMAFMSQFTVRCVYNVFTGSAGLVALSASCRTPDKGQRRGASSQELEPDNAMTSVRIQSNPYFLSAPGYVRVVGSLRGISQVMIWRCFRLHR